jgi:hypothetical protein
MYYRARFSAGSVKCEQRDMELLLYNVHHKDFPTKSCHFILRRIPEKSSPLLETRDVEARPVHVLLAVTKIRLASRLTCVPSSPEGRNQARTGDM